MLLYLHGGGFMLGGLDSHDDICAEICDSAHVGVVAVGYRLAPEHHFPAAFDDCLAAFDADRKSTRLNSSHLGISYAVFCLKKKNNNIVISSRIQLVNLIVD